MPSVPYQLRSRSPRRDAECANAVDFVVIIIGHLRFVDKSLDAQKLSALMISPPFRVPIARQVCRLTESLTNLTDPSPKQTLTPPG